MKPKLNIQKAGKKAWLGLQDRGYKVIKCNCCQKTLMIFQITKDNNDLIKENNKPIFTRIMVLCGFCDNESRVETIEGQFYPGSPDDSISFEPIEKYKGTREADVYFVAWKSKDE